MALVSLLCHAFLKVCLSAEPDGERIYKENKAMGILLMLLRPWFLWSEGKKKSLSLWVLGPQPATDVHATTGTTKGIFFLNDLLYYLTRSLFPTLWMDWKQKFSFHQYLVHSFWFHWRSVEIRGKEMGNSLPVSWYIIFFFKKILLVF